MIDGMGKCLLANSLMENIEHRKADHLNLAGESQTEPRLNDTRFNYEPLLGVHPDKQKDHSFFFLGKSMNAPLWISSMTGGTKDALSINKRLARICGEFGLGMGVGSCRPLLSNKKYINQFNWRSLLGESCPFFANLGIAQVESLLQAKESDRLEELVDTLKADGLIVHVNPLQEWFQQAGNGLNVPPLETIENLLEHTSFKVIVKEVGQGFGPKSLCALLKLPVDAVDFAAFGGTNFPKLEALRQDKKNNPLFYVGHRAEEMIALTKSLLIKGDVRCRHFIVSGGIKSFLDGYYFKKKLEQVNKVMDQKITVVYAQAHVLLKQARTYSHLHSFVSSEIEGLRLAENYLHLKEHICT